MFLRSWHSSFSYFAGSQGRTLSILRCAKGAEVEQQGAEAFPCLPHPSAQVDSRKPPIGPDSVGSFSRSVVLAKPHEARETRHTRFRQLLIAERDCAADRRWGGTLGVAETGADREPRAVG